MLLATPRAHIVVPVVCSQCHGAVLLECEGAPTYPGYKTYNEYACPYCRKHEIQQTPGAIVTVSKAVATGG